jgi:hypothetical protein
MKTICFLGIERSFKKFLVEYFIKKKSIIVDKKSICISGGKFLLNFDSNKSLDKRKSIFLFGGKTFSKNTVIPDESICICLSKDGNTLSHLYNKNINVITCGYSSTDTVTFSSLDIKKPLISIQRQIKNLDGKTIEPLEFSNNFTLKNDDSILLFNALLICL